MKITEIASLLGKGYKVDEIKELVELSTNTPEVLEMAKTGTKLSDIKDLVALADSGADNQSQSKDQEPDESDQTPDYKVLYEDLKKKSEELEQTVSKIQNDNAARDNSGKQPEEKSIDEVLADIMLNSI